LNPEESDRYFGDVKIGDKVVFVKKKEIPFFEIADAPHRENEKTTKKI